MVKNTSKNEEKAVSDKTVTVEEKVSKKRRIALLSEDVDFVRGKKTSKLETKPLKVESDNIFKENADHVFEVSKAKKPKEDSDLGKPLEDLSYKKLSPGMLMLGVVTEVGEIDVVLSLPNGLTGFIRGTDISEEFNQAIDNNTEEDDLSDNEQEDLDLCDVIKVGQYLTCSVMEVTTVNKTKKVNLTTKPEIINCSVKKQDINKNMVLQGVINSVEEYGYLVNLGIKGVTAFLNKGDLSLKKCDIVSVVVKTVNDGNLILGLYEAGTAKALSDKTVTTFSSLSPGHLVNVTVKKHAANGIRCTFLGGIQGSVHLIHLKDMYNDKAVQEVYPLKRKIPARVILINPENKRVLLSTLNCHVAMETPCNLLKKGDAVEDAEVVRVTKRGVYISLENDVTGFVHLKKLQDKEVEKVGANFKVGTKHKARVMGFRILDNLVQLSLRQSDLDKPFLSYHDIKVCSVVMVTILSVEEFGLVVKLADNIRGFVPKLHLADINIKNPSLKFKENQRVKAKVLTVDPSKRRLTLTLKRSIIKNSTSDVSGYATLEKDQQVTGWIAAIKQFGIIMNFPAKIRGLVHSSDISNVPMTEADIKKLYRIGQVLSCRVVHVNPEKEKLSLSLNLLEELETKNSEETTGKWARRGQIHSCTVLSRSKGDNDGLIVQLDSTKEEAFLPFYHLSDYKTLSELNISRLQPGTKIKQVLIISKKMKKITVTAKPSIINWVKSFEQMPKISDLTIGDFVVGYIKDFQDYGCFVEIGNGLVGLCPKACLADSFVSNPRDVYKSGETVMCKITNIDTEKERLLVSLKHSDVGAEPSMSGGKLLEGYFSELEMFSKTEHQQIGTVVECEVVSVSENWYNVKVGALSGMVDRKCAEVGLKVGDVRKGVVLDFTQTNRGTYYVSMETSLVENVEGRGKKKKLTEGAELSATVVLKAEDYFVVVIPDAAYRFGYVHRRVHLSDLGQSYRDVRCGQEHKVSVFCAKKGKPLLLSFVCSEPETPASLSRKRKRSEDQDLKFDDIKLGEVYTVTVKSVKTLQLNVQLSRKVNGRVHITEVTDSPDPDSNPLREFKHGDTLQVKLIGFRHSKTHRYLPITRTDYVRSMGEFSLRESVISSSKVREIKENEKVDETKDLISSLVVGQQITGFVKSIDSSGFLWISLSPGVEARLWHTLTSSDKEEVEKWTERFAVGQCVSATVFSTRDNKIDLSLVGPLTADAKFWCLVKATLGIGLKLQINARDFGIAPLTELNDNFTKDPLSKYHENDLVQCVVVEAPTESSRRTTLSLRKSRTSQRWKKAVGGRKVVNQVVTKPEDLEVDTVYSGYVKSTSSTAGIFVSLGINVTGRVLMKNMSDNYLKNWEPMFPIGKLVKVFVLQNGPKVELSMKLSDLKKGKKKEEEGEDEEEEVQRCLDDILLERYKESDGEEEDDEDAGEAEEEEEVMEIEDAPKIVFSSKETTTLAQSDKERVSLRDVLVDDKSESEDECEEEKPDETETKKGKSFLKREKKRKKEEAEEEIRRIEMKSNSAVLETEDDFEREVASKPDGGASWVCYMAYWLGLGNVDKARLTARRALDTINYRLEEEKLNVWSALFNLENSFGTQDGLMKVCKEAAAVNDSKTVFLRLAAVLDKSKKYQELDDVYSSVLLKKHKKSRKVWCNYCTSLASQSRLPEMRELLTKALKSLPKDKHIRTICHFAQTEYKQGDPNRGSTMFENVLTTYPHRLDLWAVYLDKTISLNDKEQSRLLLDRMIGLKLPMKKMKFFFKRYIDFETVHGDAASLKLIKEKAQNYLSTNQDD
ncbi:hypothetical protein ACHWQZ_G018470 [Mnemiopsis leidyi]